MAGGQASLAGLTELERNQLCDKLITDFLKIIKRPYSNPKKLMKNCTA